MSTPSTNVTWTGRRLDGSEAAAFAAVPAYGVTAVRNMNDATADLDLELNALDEATAGRTGAVSVPRPRHWPTRSTGIHPLTLTTRSVVRTAAEARARWITGRRGADLVKVYDESLPRGLLRDHGSGETEAASTWTATFRSA